MEENQDKNTFEAETASAEDELTPTDENGAEEKKKKSLGREILEWVEAIVLAIILALVIRSFIFTVVRVDGQSMNSTLANNDRLIVWRLGYEPKQGDIVIFAPEIPDNESRNFLNRIYWVKRVIATEGQHVEIDYDSNSVFVDGVKLDEPYLYTDPDNPNYDVMDEASVMGHVTSIDIPEGHVFLMGDNRNNSRDGRSIGPVDVDDIVGEAVFRFWPFNSIGGVR